ncbi:hypothetical protein [Peribacillus asahii]|uniref:hypothetical protein n=1 Tax=Peribacillus asahii TaxID=228899 RepID=UPI00382454C0
MKKIFLSCVSVILSCVIIFNFSTQEASAHHVKVTLDGMELKKGQIGSIYIKKSTKIYNYIDGKLVFYKTAKVKEKYRVYKVNEGTKTYSIGSKQYIKISDKNITYKKVPKSQYDKVNTVHDYAYRGTYWGDSISQVKKIVKSKLEGSDGDWLMYKTETFGYKSATHYFFEKNKLENVMVSFELEDGYYSLGNMRRIHDTLYPKLKKELNTRNEGFTNENGTSTTWNLKSRSVHLSIYDNKYYETKLGILYSPPEE